MNRRRSKRPRLLLALALLACLTLQGGLPLASQARAEDPEGTGYAGLALAEALRDLRSRGLKIVFTSEVVRPEMKVAVEPVATEPREILDEILEPHGLVAQEGPRGALVVVRRAGVATSRTEGMAVTEGERTERTVRLDRSPVVERVVVTPSRVSLLRDEPATRIGLSRDEILALPHLGDDFFRAVSLLPGISANDVSAQFNVRGGRRDETLIMLDGQELYEAYHLKDFDGALSFVASSTLGSADLSTGGFAAEFGDRMSGVLDMTTISPSGRPQGRIGGSVLSLQAGGAGGFDNDRGGWLVELRRGTIDLVEDLLGNEDPRHGDAYAKLEYRLDDRNSVRLHLLFSTDEFTWEEIKEDESKRTDTDYRNTYFWLTHRMILSSKLFVDTAVSRTGLDQDRRGVEVEELVQFDIRDRRETDVLGVRQGWNFQATPRHFIKGGFEIRGFDTEYDYDASFEFDDPLAVIRDDPEAGSTVFADRFEEKHVSLYLADQMRLADPVTLELGVRHDRHSLTNERFLSPRLNLAWAPDEVSVFRVAWGRFLQSQRPYELQVEDGEDLFQRTERSEHRVIGYERTFPNASKSGGLALRAEIYQRRVSNPRVRFENLYEALNTFPEVEPDRVRIEPDRSVAEGIEFFLRGQAGERLRWWANYAYATTEDEIAGRDVARSIDQRHTLNVDLDYRVGRHWHLNLAWRYHTGWPTTPLSLREEVDEEGETVFVPVLGPLYSVELSDYHRMDVRASRRFRAGDGEIVFFVDIQNVYDRKNIAGFDTEIDEEEGTIETETEYWAGALPSVGFTYRF